MPRPTIPNLDARIARIAQDVVDLPAESTTPIGHYERGANDAWNLLQYFERNAGRAVVRPTVLERHVRRLRMLALVGLVEAFERFLKEVAAVCVDHVAPLVLDDRLDVLRVDATDVAAHFTAQTIGHALCEGDTWLNVESIQRRFGRLLADHHSTNAGIQLFPKGQRRTTLETIFQLRHTVVHNLGVLTRTDAAKLRLMTRTPVAAPKVLWLTNGDVWYVKLWLDETAEWANDQIRARLATLLTDLHTADPSLFDPPAKAAALATTFGKPVTIAGATANP
ncbi:MAG: hypothetical protein M9894_39290 [Planctomycetes bacterium]|nr:hypothetical protein [Planctomycetota bacterium]